MYKSRKEHEQDLELYYGCQSYDFGCIDLESFDHFLKLTSWHRKIRKNLKSLSNQSLLVFHHFFEQRQYPADYKKHFGKYSSLAYHLQPFPKKEQMDEIKREAMNLFSQALNEYILQFKIKPPTKRLHKLALKLKNKEEHDELKQIIDSIPQAEITERDLNGLTYFVSNTPKSYEQY